MEPRGGASALTAQCKGFTLAEVLITLGIIGVVAALSIPTLINKYQEKVTVTKVKKMYSTLTNAYELYKIENGPAGFIEYSSEGAEEAYNIFAPYLKVSKDCGTTNNGTCISQKYKYLSRTGTLNYGANETYYSIVLNDGSTLIFRGGDGAIDIEIFYDINGVAEPNQWGFDLFEFDVSSADDILKPNSYNDYETSCIAEDAKGWECTSWIIYKGNMDYLKK